MTTATWPGGPPLLWDLDPAEHPPDGYTGPYPAQRWEIVSCAGSAIVVALIDRQGTPRVVRAPMLPGRPLVWTSRITEDVRGREDEAFAEMLGYARVALEQHAAAEAARALTRVDGASCAGGPDCGAPAPPGAIFPEGTGGDETSECQDLGDRLCAAGRRADPFDLRGPEPWELSMEVLRADTLYLAGGL